MRTSNCKTALAVVICVSCGGSGTSKDAADYVGGTDEAGAASDGSAVTVASPLPGDQVVVTVDGQSTTYAVSYGDDQVVPLGRGSQLLLRPFRLPSLSDADMADTFNISLPVAGDRPTNNKYSYHLLVYRDHERAIFPVSVAAEQGSTALPAGVQGFMAALAYNPQIWLVTVESADYLAPAQKLAIGPRRILPDSPNSPPSPAGTWAQGWEIVFEDNWETVRNYDPQLAAGCVSLDSCQSIVKSAYGALLSEIGGIYEQTLGFGAPAIDKMTSATGASVYPVHFGGSQHNFPVDGGIEMQYGMNGYSYHSRRISLSTDSVSTFPPRKNADGESLKATLAHELMHAILHGYLVSYDPGCLLGLSEGVAVVMGRWIDADPHSVTVRTRPGNEYRIDGQLFWPEPSSPSPEGVAAYNPYMNQDFVAFMARYYGGVKFVKTLLESVAGAASGNGSQLESVYAGFDSYFSEHPIDSQRTLANAYRKFVLARAYLHDSSSYLRAEDASDPA